jgi:hypothetical protein
VARARNIKPGFFKNEVLAEMPCEARLLFIGLWTLADREGRLEDRHRRIGAELFAFDRFDVDSMLTQLQDGGFLLRYEANGVRYIQIENFVKHQDPHYKEKASEIPPPDGRENLMLASGVTRTQRARILERDGYVCLSCGAKEHLCIDHVLPVSRGGDSSDENLQTLCLSCNTKKGNKLDGETKNAYLRRDRVDFEWKLAEQRGASPSESLSSDSPSSDSLTPEKETVARKRAPAFDPKSMELPGWLAPAVWFEWCDDRKERGKPITARAAKKQFAQLLEYDRQGFSAESVVSHSIAGGFQGLYPPQKSRGWQAAPTGTTPTPANADAALKKLDADKNLTAPPPAEVRQRLAELRRA